MKHYAPVDRALCRRGIKPEDKIRDEAEFLAHPERCGVCVSQVERKSKKKNLAPSFVVPKKDYYEPRGER